KNTPTKYAIKKFVDNKEVYLTKTVNPHANIIQFYGVTKKKDEEKYSLVLEYAEGGTLRDCLRNNTIEWNNQLRFAREIASAILWLHVDKGIVHGDLVSIFMVFKNYLPNELAITNAFFFSIPIIF
ncbi:hypothetical protein RhiirC2_756698, partial [Rhizophagus irregularis]